MPQDKFENTADSLISPASDCFGVTPSDSLDLARSTRAIYVGTGGDLKVLTIGSSSPVTFRNIISGSILDIRIRQVFATGTTAQDLVGLA
jgi:hypothetical protein